MRKKLKIHERLLLGIAFCSDQLIDIWQEGRAVRKYRHFEPWFGRGYKPSNLRQNIYRLLKTGYIEKVVKNGKPYLRLTSKSNERLKRDFPIFKMQNRKWDNKWRIVIFDISEKEKDLRDDFRNKLKELGFAMLQKSIYISPYDFVQDMYEFLKTEELLGKAFILTSRHELMGDPRDLADHIWKINELQQEYENLWQEIIHIDEAENREEAIKKIKNKYLELIQKDPCLPYELLPVDWMGDRVRKGIIKL